MNKLITISCLFALVVLFSSAIERVHKSAGPPSCNAGEPPNNTNCTNCHNDGLVNTGSANIVFDLGGADTDYVAGRTYTITVSVSKPGLRRAGFQSIALQDNNNKISPGKLALTDATRTQLIDKNIPHSGGCLEEERVWIEHTYAGNSSNESGTSLWSYKWTAPSAGVGAITFYLAALEANNDLSETGDQVYTIQKTIAGLPVGINESELIASFIVSASATELIIESSVYAPEKFALFTTTGALVKQWTKEDTQMQTYSRFSTENIPKGVYFVKLMGSFGAVVKKVFIY